VLRRPSEQGAYSLPPAYIEQAVRDVALQFSGAGVRLALVLNQALAANADLMLEQTSTGPEGR
jgi:hypothetical protein